MSWEEQNGVLIGCRQGDTQIILSAMESALTKLSLTRSGDGDDSRRVSCQRFVGSDGVWFITSLSRSLARGLALHLATLSGQTATLLHAYVRFREDVKPACLYDGYETTVDARGRFGSVEPSVLERIKLSAADLDTDKPWRIAEWVLDCGLEYLVPGQKEQLESWVWFAPAPLADPRLERIVQAVRAGGSCERVEVAGRQALRVREIDGTVATAFLSDAEIGSILEALEVR